MDQWKEMVTFGLALVGAVLGVINTWRNVNRDRLKVRVRFIHGFSINAPTMPARVYGVEVTNLSTFPVTVSEVGLHIVGTKDRAAFIPHIMPDGGDPLPRRLEAREQVTVYIPTTSLCTELQYKNVYAITACGATIRKRQRGLPPPRSRRT